MLVLTSDGQLRLGDLDGLPWLSGQIYWQFLPLFLIYRHHLSHLKRHYETVLRWDIQPLKYFYFKRNHLIYNLKKIRVKLLIKFTEFIAYLILCRCYLPFHAFNMHSIQDEEKLLLVKRSSMAFLGHGFIPRKWSQFQTTST